MAVEGDGGRQERDGEKKGRKKKGEGEKEVVEKGRKRRERALVLFVSPPAEVGVTVGSPTFAKKE